VLSTRKGTKPKGSGAIRCPFVFWPKDASSFSLRTSNRYLTFSTVLDNFCHRKLTFRGKCALAAEKAASRDPESQEILFSN
jgi:hypothetical protein